MGASCGLCPLSLELDHVVEKSAVAGRLALAEKPCTSRDSADEEFWLLAVGLF